MKPTIIPITYNRNSSLVILKKDKNLLRSFLIIQQSFLEVIKQRCVNSAPVLLDGCGVPPSKVANSRYKLGLRAKVKSKKLRAFFTGSTNKPIIRLING